MNNFNLIDEPWIPVRDLEGSHRQVSLGDAFRDAEQIADLDAAPHERISLMRLLVCITQSVLGAPDSPDDWDGFDDDLQSRIPDYLQKPEIHPHFNLFGDGPRFLQVPLSKTKQTPLLDFLEFKFKSNSTLFDHSAGIEAYVPNPKLALNLLCFQNCFIGGGTGSPANGGVTGNGPAIKFLNAFLIGQNLKQTIILNCLEKGTVETWGDPIWETGFDSADPWALLTRLAPISCKVWLDPPRMYISQGLEFPLEDGQGKTRKLIFRDPYSTIKVSEDQRYLLRADLAKGVWKDLHVITLLRTTDQPEQQAPLNLQCHVEGIDHTCFTLWVGEFIKAKDAKVIDSLQSFFTLPKKMIYPDGQAIYASGVIYSQTVESRLRAAVTSYYQILDDGFQKRVKSGEEKTNIKYTKQHYWNALESKVDVLLDLVGSKTPMTENFGEADDPWTVTVRDAARAAYEHSCPRQTPRQLQAYAAGLKKLYFRKKSSPKD